MSSAMITAAPSDRDEGLQRTSQAFERLAEPFRREIKLHCFRAWLYKIATNACLNAIESRKHAQRFLPDQRAPAAVEMPNGVLATDVAWLEPYPDSNLDGIVDEAPNPEARYASREAVRLAFVAAIQQLPPRQRAVLLLCDVLGWAAAEAATLLGGSTASINSALQRARETLGKRHPKDRPGIVSPVVSPPDSA